MVSAHHVKGQDQGSPSIPGPQSVSSQKGLGEQDSGRSGGNLREGLAQEGRRQGVMGRRWPRRKIGSSKGAAFQKPVNILKCKDYFGTIKIKRLLQF